MQNDCNSGKTICEWAKMVCFEDAFALGLLRNQSTSRVSAGNQHRQTIVLSKVCVCEMITLKWMRQTIDKTKLCIAPRLGNLSVYFRVQTSYHVPFAFLKPSSIRFLMQFGACSSRSLRLANLYCKNHGVKKYNYGYILDFCSKIELGIHSLVVCLVRQQRIAIGWKLLCCNILTFIHPKLSFHEINIQQNKKQKKYLVKRKNTPLENSSSNCVQAKQSMHVVLSFLF